jgi:hypothetical protein
LLSCGVSDGVVVTEASQSKCIEHVLYEFYREGLLNEVGVPRLHRAREYFETHDDLGMLVDLYSFWRDSAEYILLRRFDERKDRFVAKAVKCSKRGNDVYVARCRKRFNFLSNMDNDVVFFSPSDFDVKTDVRTSLLWFTLTYDTKRCSRSEAWRNIGHEWNCFISAMRRRYGRISVMRSYEAFGNGYPHVHAILWFEETSFKVFPWIEGLETNEQKESVSSGETLGSRDGLDEDTMLPPLAKQSSTSERVRYTYRISDKADFESLWHSWVDTTAISSMKKATNYVSKYQMKVSQGRETSGSQTTLDQHTSGARTMALMWLHRKRSFSVSGSFGALWHDLICSMHNSNHERQVDLLGNVVPVEKWTFLGVFTARDLGLRDWEWAAEVSVDVVDHALERRGHG